MDEELGSLNDDGTAAADAANNMGCVSADVAAAVDLARISKKCFNDLTECRFFIMMGKSSSSLLVTVLGFVVVVVVAVGVASAAAAAAANNCRVELLACTPVRLAGVVVVEAA